MCQTLAIYMDCFVACVCVCATLVCTTYACWQRTRATPSKFHWLDAYGASKGVLNNARATRSQRSSPRPELPCSPTWANVIAMATIASNSGKKNKHKTNDHDSNSNQKNAHNQYQKDNDHDSNSNQKNVHNQYQKDNDSSKIRQSPRPRVSPFLILCVVCLCLCVFVCVCVCGCVCCVVLRPLIQPFRRPTGT